MMKRTAHILLLLVLLCALGALLVPLYMIATTSSAIYASSATVPSEPVAMILGASVSSDGALSPVVRERADTAVALYHTHKVEKILVTGDDGSLAYNEVYPIGKYLLFAGVPQSDIFLDYAGFDTYSSMYRARSVFGVTSLIIVSQRFHLPRALYISRSLGLTAYGVDASRVGDSYAYNFLREVPASSKALWDILSHRVPKYLGTQFPIKGDGSATWVGGAVEMVYFE